MSCLKISGSILEELVLCEGRSGCHRYLKSFLTGWQYGELADSCLHLKQYKGL